MAFVPVLLEDSLDPWLAIEADPDRRQLVIRFLMDVCEQEGVWEGSRRVQGTALPAFGAMVPGAGVVMVWVVAEAYRNIAVRYLYDIVTGQRFGG